MSEFKSPKKEDPVLALRETVSFKASEKKSASFDPLSELFECKILSGPSLFEDTDDIGRHSFLYFQDDGSVIHFYDGSERTPSNGAVCYISPNAGYYITSTSIDPKIRGFCCKGKLADYFSEYCQAQSVHISLRPTAVDAYNEIADMIAAGVNENGTTEAKNRQVLAFYKLYIELIFAQSRVVESKPSLIAQNIRQYIDDNIGTDISVTSIAKQFYLSETHVIRIFREKYGVTPKQYILKAKIDQSKILLLDTSLQIKEIAMTYHFADSYHFSHTFKRFTGISPEKFRMREDERKKN